ncbi:GNAT family N-acetyltransferase [Pseudoxanthomonas composti]|jgi:[ribosomal protein S5]-alanine N-acetyltransferase|uniref:N-acetyltransferase n=1 Tax=Pseudoxanthomonas composti TaxID=2137479 RepID=A0A4Q1K0F7_9GAMM|nr:GNAT family N-acetyltransferase [Pseudoxanthomonas composti]RXR08879.1 N-acetyltransferase [Pseudoxanthomonas composti]
MQPVLETPRLLLRPYLATDAAHVQRLAGDARVADTTANIPHPYPDGAAQAWIAGLAPALAAGTRVAYAITLRQDGSLIGTVDLHEISAGHARAMLGYWIGVPYWGQGYATEAARRLIEHGQTALGLSRIGGACLARNPASAQVMEKLGLRLEGRLIAHECKHGLFEDLLLYGLVLPGRVPPVSPA